MVACLIALETPQYGYGLLKELETAEVPTDTNTLYPLLRRLEDQGLLMSSWDTTKSRPRKFYQVSELGRELRTQLLADVNAIGQSLEHIDRQTMNLAKGGTS